MKHTTTETITRQDVLDAIENYLIERKHKHKGETIGGFLFQLYGAHHVAEEIEQTSIEIGLAMAAFCNPEVKKVLDEKWGEYAISKFCDFLASLNRALLYTAACKTAMTEAAAYYWSDSDSCENVLAEALHRIKTEYEIRLERLQGGQDFE